MPNTEKLNLIDEFQFVDKRKYGITTIHLFNWQPD